MNVNGSGWVQGLVAIGKTRKKMKENKKEKQTKEGKGPFLSRLDFVNEWSVTASMTAVHSTYLPLGYDHWEGDDTQRHTN